MKSLQIFSVVALLLPATMPTNAQESKLQVTELNQPLTSYFGQLNLSPVEGDSYFIANSIFGENPITGEGEGGFFGLQPDPTTGVINDAVMDDQSDVIGTDFADIFGFDMANPVVAMECLESLGVDPVNNRFILRLSVGVSATGTESQWDTLDMDLFDPADFDQDGDLNEPDGIFDTGDGILDAPFPLDPVGLGFQIDLDGDGDPTNDPLTLATSQGLAIGNNTGPIQFDPAAGPVTVISANWELRGFDDEVADINSDGVTDGPFDVSAFSTFGSPSGWDGSLNVAFTVDGNPATIQDSVGGMVKSSSLVVEYFSDIDNEFCYFDEGPQCGDINGDGTINLLDVQPFVAILISGEFEAVADINGDGEVNLLDVEPFVLKLTNG